MAPVLLAAGGDLLLIAEVPKFVDRGSLCRHLHEHVPHPLVNRASCDDRVVQNPDALHDGTTLLLLPPYQLLRPVAPKWLAAVLVAPSRFRVAGLYVRTATLARMEGHLSAVRLVLGECDGFHVDAGHGLRIHLRVVE